MMSCIAITLTMTVSGDPKFEQTRDYDPDTDDDTEAARSEAAEALYAEFLDLHHSDAEQEPHVGDEVVDEVLE